MAEIKRATRVAEGLRQELATLLLQRVRDPRVGAGVVVSRIEMSSDLRTAKVHVRLLEGGDQDPRRKTLLEGLERARHMLQREATRALQLRFVPELRFYYDDGTDKTSRIEQLLDEIEAERNHSPDR